MALKLADYSLIGNAHTAALVSKYGSIDWCCLPDFDSEAIFASLLDETKGGQFSITPVNAFESTQQYITDTNVIQTRFKTEEGCVVLTDAFTAMTEEEKLRGLFPDQEVLRVLDCPEGEVKMEMIFHPRKFYGKDAMRLEMHGKLGIYCSTKGNVVYLHSSIPADLVKLNEDKSIATAIFKIKAGEKIIFSLSFSQQSPAIIAEVRETGWMRMQQTISFWKQWIGQCKYEGKYQKEVRRSALVLKLLTFAPSGAIVASPTSSLPEDPGGERNWDYRFCWLRDASFTVRALARLGFTEEIHAYMSWITHATRLTHPELQVVYSIYGNATLKEVVLPWLKGYQSSKPVRVGNAAHKQFQLDVYGEVLDAVCQYAPMVKGFDRATKKFVLGLGTVICKLWNKEDDGIWEIRSVPQHHTHSKVMAWTGLDRLISLCEEQGWNGAPMDKFRSTRDKLKKEIEEKGYNNEISSYTRAFGSKDTDGSLLVLPLTGYIPADHQRMLGTINFMKQSLSRNGLLYRYKNVDDGMQGGEGSFALCDFWLCENLALTGRTSEAIELFEQLLRYASPTGLLSEEIEPLTGELRGNYPQGFTHIELINAALVIDASEKRKAA
jgi:GH15 family glucan-1,4-alpha-glucosidase